MHLFAKSPFGPDAEAVANQQHPDQQLGIDRGAASIAVERGQMLADTGQIDKPVNRPQQVILGDMIVDRELIKQRALRLLLRSQHRICPPLLGTIEPGAKPQINKSFSTKYALTATFDWTSA